MLSKGLIVSVQGYSRKTTEELIIEIANAGAVAIRTDKKSNSRLPLIGLIKNKVRDRKECAYITNTLDTVKEVEKWTKYIAIDYRIINDELEEISNYCKEKRLIVIADISNIFDYMTIKENDYYYSYIATTLSVLFNEGYNPDFELIEKLNREGCKNIIAEGNFYQRNQLYTAYELGACNVCVGNAITNVFRLTRNFSSVNIRENRNEDTKRI